MGTEPSGVLPTGLLVCFYLSLISHTIASWRIGFQSLAAFEVPSLKLNAEAPLKTVDNTGSNCNCICLGLGRPLCGCGGGIGVMWE